MREAASAAREAREAVVEQMEDELSITEEKIPTLAEKRKRSKIARNMKKTLSLPVLPVRNTVLLPHMIVPLLITHEQSLKAIDEAMRKDRKMFVVTQLNAE